MLNDRCTPVPSEVDLKLRLGIFRVLEAKYRSRFGDQCKFLCAGIMNWALLELPGNEVATKYLDTNRQLIEQEAMCLHRDRDLALAFSILYSLSLIRLGPRDPDLSMNIVDRATELNIVILSAKDICPTDNALEFLSFVDQYANRLLGT
jgi:hypothetical protein